MREVAAAGLEAGAVVPSEVVEARLRDQLVLWVEACSKRALLASLLLGLMVRDSFTRVTALADGQELLEEIPAEDADIPDFAERNLYLQLGRGVPPPGLQSRPSAAVVAVLAAYPTLGDELDVIPRYPQDTNTVDDGDEGDVCAIEFVIKAIVDAKVDVAQSAKSAFDDKFEAHQALAKAVKSAFSPSPSSPSPQASRPSPGIIETKVQVLTDLAQAMWGEYLHPKWAEQRMRLHGAQEKVLERYFKKVGVLRLEEEAASVSQQEWGADKQLVVFFGNAGIGTRGGWGAKAVQQACRKVVERPNSGKPTDRVPGRVVTVDEFRTSRVSSILNSPQPCEEELDSSKPSRPEDWKPKPGQVQDRLLRSAWSKRFEAPVRGLMWCPWLAQATPGELGKWVDRDCNAALNLQRAGESKWRPLKLCRWPHRGRLPAQGKEYPALGFKKLRERAPKAQAQQPARVNAWGRSLAAAALATPPCSQSRLARESEQQQQQQQQQSQQQQHCHSCTSAEALTTGWPPPAQAQRNMQANGAAHWAHNHNNSWHAKKCMRHTLMRGVAAAGLEAGAVVPSEVVEARLHDQLVLWVEACSKRALLASLLLGLMVRDSFTRVTALADGQELLEEIPAEDADIPDFAERNLYLQLGRGVPPPGLQSRPSAAVVAVLAAYPSLGDELNAIPRYPHDGNTVDDVGQKLETSFATSLNELFKRRVGQAVALAGARVIAGSHEHQRRFGLPVDGSPAWTERQRSWVVRSVRGKVVTWLEGQAQGQGGVVPTEAMRDEVARQRRLLGVGEGVVVNKAWRQRGVNRGSLLRHAVDTSRQLEAAHVSWQADWADWQALGGQPNSRPYRPPSPFALTPSCSCKAHHVKLDTKAIYGLMRAAGMLPANITSLTRFRNVGCDGCVGLQVANRWIAFLPSSIPPAVQPSIWPNDGQTFAQVVHTDGVTVSLLFTRPKPAGPPAELPRMGKQEGAVNPLAHLDADWLGCDPGKTNMATVAHEERYPSGAVESVWQRSLTAGQYYRQSGITQHAKVSNAWMAGIQPAHVVLSQVTNYTASLQRYREYVAMTLVTWPDRWAELSKPRWSNARFRMYGHKQSTVAKFWAETVRGAMVRCNSAATGRPLALAYGAASFSGGGSRGSRGVPVKHMLREACKQFPGRVLLVHEFRTSRVSSARTDVVAGQPESFRWLRPVRSMATRSRIRGLMCSTSNGIRFYDRDVSAALNIRRIAAGPGRPRELSSWLGRPAMPNPGRPGQEWDTKLVRKSENYALQITERVGSNRKVLRAVSVVCLLCSAYLSVNNIPWAQTQHNSCAACVGRHASTSATPPPPSSAQSPAVLAEAKQEFSLFLYTSGTPFARADNPHLKRMFQLLGVHDSPTAKQMRTSYLSSSYSRLKKKVTAVVEQLLLLKGKDVEEAAMWRCIDLHRRLPNGGAPQQASRWTPATLEEAYQRCGQVTSEFAKTFYLGTQLMTPIQAKSIWAIYALDRWEERLEATFAGRPYDVLDAALSDTISKFPMDIQPFKDMIEGMRMDLHKTRYQTFDELYEYCYRVAGTVGLMTMPVMGIDPSYKGPMDVVYKAALALGTANQLTNILRDVGEDARERNRIYLPMEDLHQFGLTEQDVLGAVHVPSQGKVSEKWRAFMKFQIARARQCFADAESGVDQLEAKARWPVWSALILYRQILDAIEKNDYDNFSQRAYVSKAKKMATEAEHPGVQRQNSKWSTWSSHS
ncbi:hypothetical protein QJQ45_028162 [Haematococcus lacustris]|nr:hypothetical protein QJQ45_028162 [Haematococcus lacustris]